MPSSSICSRRARNNSWSPFDLRETYGSAKWQAQEARQSIFSQRGAPGNNCLQGAARKSGIRARQRALCSHPGAGCDTRSHRRNAARCGGGRCDGPGRHLRHLLCNGRVSCIMCERDHRAARTGYLFVLIQHSWGTISGPSQQPAEIGI